MGGVLGSLHKIQAQNSASGSIQRCGMKNPGYIWMALTETGRAAKSWLQLAHYPCSACGDQTAGSFGGSLDHAFLRRVKVGFKGEGRSTQRWLGNEKQRASWLTGEKDG